MSSGKRSGLDSTMSSSQNETKPKPENVVHFVVEGQHILTALSVLKKKNKKFNECVPDPKNEIHINYTTFNAFNTFVIYSQFDGLLIENKNDFHLIRQICELSVKFEANKLKEKLCTLLMKKELTIENMKPISGIAVEFGYKVLVSKVTDFIKNSYRQLLDKDGNIDIQLSDVNFIVNGQQVRALMCPLIDQSQIFEQLIKNSNTMEIQIPNTTLAAFETVIRFLYCGQLEVLPLNNLNLIEEVCKLSVECKTPIKLMTIINEQLKQCQITNENINHFSTIGSIYKIMSINDKVQAFIRDQFANLIDVKPMVQLIDLNDSSGNRVLEVTVDNYHQISAQLGQANESLADHMTLIGQIMLNLNQAEQALAIKDNEFNPLKIHLTELEERLNQSMNETMQLKAHLSNVNYELEQTKDTLNETLSQLSQTQIELSDQKEKLRQYGLEYIKLQHRVNINKV